MVATALSLIFPLAMVWAMVSDLRTFEIPNRLSIALVLVYPLAAFFAGLSWQTMAWAFSLGTLMLVAAMVAAAFGILGGGDGKLLAAAAVWTGPEVLLQMLLITALAGGAVALVLLLYRRLPLPAALSGFATMRQLHAKGKDIPYAVAIGSAGLVIFPQLPTLDW